MSSMSKYTSASASADDMKPNPQQEFFASVIKSHRHKAERVRQDFDAAAALYRGDVFNPDGNDIDHITGDRYRYDDHDEDGSSAELAPQNHLYAFADSLVATICPSDPEVTVTSPRRKLRKAAAYRSALVSETFRVEDVGEKLWALTVRAVVFPHAFLKCTWSSKRQYPSVEVVNPHFIWFDTTAKSFRDIRYIIEATALTANEFKNRIKRRGGKGYYSKKVAEKINPASEYPGWMESRDLDNSKDDSSNIVRQNYQWVTVYEVYDLVGKKLYHYGEGCDVPLYEGPLPYDSVDHPYMILTFNDNLKDLEGMSDAKLAGPTIERLDDLTSLQLWHVKTAIPATVIHDGLVDDPEEFMTAFSSLSGPGQVLRLSALPKARINDVMGQTPTTQLPIEWTPMMEELKSIIQFVFGLPGYMRGEVGNADVATELALADSAVKTRNARRQKALYKVVEWLARHMLHLYAEFMTNEAEIAAEIDDSHSDDVFLTREKMFLPYGGSQEDPFTWRYKCNPFDGQQENSVVQLKTIAEFGAYLFQNPDVNQRKLTERLLELLKMASVLADEDAAAAMQQAMMPPGGGAPMDPAAMAAMAAAGGGAGVPGAQGMPAEMAQMMGGNQEAAQAIPSGVAGGSIPVG